MKNGFWTIDTRSPRKVSCGLQVAVFTGVVLLASSLFALDPKKRVTQYDIRVYKAEHGLPMNDLKAVLQDSKGYLWLACQEGLVRFDGVSFVLFDKSRHPELGENFIWDLAEDGEGNLWLATNGGGVKRFDGKFFTTFNTANGLASNVVKRILIGRDRTIWLGTENGVTRLQNGACSSYKFGNFAGNQGILALHEDREGNLLAGSNQAGLHIIRKDSVFTLPQEYCILAFGERASGEIILVSDTNRLYAYHRNRVTEFDPHEIPAAHAVRAIHEDEHGNLWCATEGSGILRHHEGRFDHLKIETGLPQEHNFFMRILEDREKNLWFVGDGGLLQLKDNKFTTFGRNEGFPSNFGHTVCEDRVGNMWAGFRNDGLAKFDRYTTQTWNTNDGLATDKVTAVFPAQDGGLWIGTSGGLNYLKDGRVREHWKEWNEVYGILSLFESSAGRLWIGMIHGFLSKFDGREFVNYPLATQSESGNVITVIERANGEVWAGTWKQGMYKLAEDRVYHFTAQDGIVADGVNAFYEDEEQVLWIATDGHGLYRYKDGEFVNINSRDGLCFDRLFSILEDDQHNLWFSGNRGIFRAGKQQLNDFADGKTDTVICRYYNHLDGMRETECNGRRQPVAWKSRDGRLWFVSTAGVVCVDPDNMPKNTLPPPVYIEEILVKNRRVFTPDSAMLAFAAAERELEFHFTAPSFTVPERVRFKYKLEGYDRDWIEADTRRTAFYTNLPHGEYAFRVMACNNDGVWNENGAAVRLSIAPFWWETWWAYILYLLVLGMAFYSVRKYEMKRIRLRNDLKMQQVRSERLEELDHLKSRFFAGISHEFRTPLTLIGGPLAEILEKTHDPGQKARVEMMLRNTRRLQRLVEELLDLAQLESGKMTLQARPVRLAPFLRGLTAAFESYATQKSIHLVFHAHDRLASEIIFIDPDKMEKVIVNLIGNALKYTGAGGKVDVVVAEGLEQRAEGKESAPSSVPNLRRLAISVRDTGAGIPANVLPHIFDYFYRYRDQNTARESGTGIGLALTKELVELHHGEISAISTEGVGSEFIISLPLGKAHLKPEEIASERLEEEESESLHLQEVTPFEEIEKEQVATLGLPAEEKGVALPTVLLIEDNPDMRRYLREYLNHDNRLLEAANGEEGLQRAMEEIPDLIISDVMMPRMDGFELCRRLKSAELTSHIPVLLLTARGSGESKMAGLTLGADDYLTKPIAGRELQLRVKNLIDRQHKLRERCRQELAAPKIEPSALSLALADHKFLQKITAVLEKRLTEPTFGPEAFAREMAISRPHLNRKLHGLLGQHTSEFIRTMRLKRAAELLRQKRGTISEIAFQVGFNHLSYFARCFKEQYGQSPSEYAES